METIGGFPAREAADYGAFYCEENVWRLLGGGGTPRARRLPDGPSWALWIRGEGAFVEIGGQGLGRGPGRAVRWDYHVIGLAAMGDTLWALDFDSVRGFPVPALAWLEASFPSAALEAAARRVAGPSPRFRLLPGADYARRFASTRAHMVGPDGAWRAPPPPWSPPAPEVGLGAWTFEELRGLEGGPGLILDLQGLRAFLTEGYRQRPR